MDRMASFTLHLSFMVWPPRKFCTSFRLFRKESPLLLLSQLRGNYKLHQSLPRSPGCPQTQQPQMMLRHEVLAEGHAAMWSSEGAEERKPAQGFRFSFLFEPSLVSGGM